MMPLEQASPLETLSYEQAYQELEGIVAALETGERALDETLRLFERGQRLIQYCSTLLDRVELKVQQVSENGLIEFNA